MTNPQMPFMDITQLMEQFKMPGVDVSAIMEARRKDIEALVAANQKAYEGMQKLGQRQAEMLRDAMAGWQATTAQVMSGQNPSAGAAKQAELANRHWSGHLRTCASLRRWPPLHRRRRGKSSISGFRKTSRNSGI